jgi:hypothetical protein
MNFPLERYLMRTAISDPRAQALLPRMVIVAYQRRDNWIMRVPIDRWSSRWTVARGALQVHFACLDKDYE